MRKEKIYKVKFNKGGGESFLSESDFLRGLKSLFFPPKNAICRKPQRAANGPIR